MYTGGVPAASLAETGYVGRRLLNLLSVAAADGVLVLVFQHGVVRGCSTLAPRLVSSPWSRS